MIAYRFALSVLALPLLGWCVARVLLGRETWRDLGVRLGGGARADPMQQDVIWVHGASVGEVTSARALIAALSAENPTARLLVTTNTLTGRAAVQAWGMQPVTAQLAPLDFRWVLWRHRRRWQPKLLIVLENELWPNRIATLRAPVIGVGTRLSKRSAARWGFAKGLARTLFSRFTLVSAQDNGSAERIIALGLPRDRLGPTGTLKSGVALAAPDPKTLASLNTWSPRPDTLLAASTHAGEEAILLDAFARARGHRPRLRLILAPRHPERGDSLAAMIEGHGFAFARRSIGAPPEPETDVILADTLGEMPLWYAAAGVTFVGGSLVAKGGHTPFEPVSAGSAVLHGPYTSNFLEPFERLEHAGASVRVTDAETLAQAIVRLASAEAQNAMAQAAQGALAGGDGESQIIIDHLRKIVSQTLTPRS